MSFRRLASFWEDVIESGWGDGTKEWERGWFEIRSEDGLVPGYEDGRAPSRWC